MHQPHIDGRSVPNEQRESSLAAVAEQFADECGIPQVWRVIIRHRITGQRWKFDVPKPFVVVGRDAKCDIVLPHRDVSRRHAYLQVLRGHIYFCDLHSRSGIRSGRRTTRTGVATPREVLGIGPFTLQFSQAPAYSLDAFTESDEFTNRQLAGFHLTSRTPTSSALAFPINDRVTLIGEIEPAHITLRHRDVAPVHCSVVRTERAFWLVDLYACGGVKLNGKNVKFAPLHEDDTISVGPFQLTLNRSTRVIRSAPAAHLVNGGPGARTVDLPRCSAATGTLPISAMQAQPAVSALSESVLLAIIREFVAIQKQLIDQHQQQMQLLIEIFNSTSNVDGDSAACRLATVEAQLRRLVGSFQGLTETSIDAKRNTAVSTSAGAQSVTRVSNSCPASDPVQSHAQVTARIMELGRQNDGLWNQLISVITQRGGVR